MDAGGRRIVMINPAIAEKSAETFDVWDSCFSADAAFFGLTRRRREITVTYADESGRVRTELFRGDLSELFQHEIDHLDGILFTDRIVDNRIVMRSEWERMAGGT
jgi:peptide deformylase